jgi:hypothetical protein
MTTQHTTRSLALFRSSDRSSQRFCQHHHARASTVWPIIDRAVIVRGEITRIPGLKNIATLFRRTTRNAALRQRIEHLREQRNDVKYHKSANQST